jgi:hypothetical protein
MNEKVLSFVVMVFENKEITIPAFYVMTAEFNNIRERVMKRKNSNVVLQVKASDDIFLEINKSFLSYWEKSHPAITVDESSLWGEFSKESFDYLRFCYSDGSHDLFCFDEEKRTGEIMCCEHRDITDDSCQIHWWKEYVRDLYM